MFGFDIMLDTELNCWLIEVNSSPAMDYSTDITERLVKMVSEDTIKVVVDYAGASEKNKKDIDTGLYKCIYKAKKTVDMPHRSFGLDLVAEGIQIPDDEIRKW